MKYPLAAAALLLASLSSSCASTQTIRYAKGSVTSSMVSYEYVAPPVLTNVAGHFYHVDVTGMGSPVRVDLTELRRQGMTSTSDAGASLTVVIQVKDVLPSEAGGMGLGGKYYPALITRVPYTVSIRNSRGTQLRGHSGVHENVAGMKGAPAFPTREEAAQATEFIKTFGSDAINSHARDGALKAATKDANSLARGLFKQQTISLDVPVVRAAAGVDLVFAYELLAKAQSPRDVQQALTTYEEARRQLAKAGGAGNTTRTTASSAVSRPASSCCATSVARGKPRRWR